MSKTSQQQELEREIPFRITLDNMKYLGIYLKRQIQQLYKHNYKTLSLQLKWDQNNQKNIYCSWVGWANIIKKDHPTQTSLFIQHHTYQTIKKLLLWIRKKEKKEKNSNKVHLEEEKIKNIRHIMKKKCEWRWPSSTRP